MNGMPTNMGSRPNVSHLRNLSDGIFAELSESHGEILDLEERIRCIGRRKTEVVDEEARIMSDNHLIDKDITLLLAHIKSIEEQIALYNEDVRPQLLYEIKQSQELADSKDKQYREKIEHYEKIWQAYLVEYNKFPKVAEMNDLLIKLKLTRIKAMKKKQKMIEMRKKAEKLQVIKAQRLEILRTEFLKCYSSNQDARLELEELQKEVMELRARVAGKKAKKLEEQQRLEEERRKQKEDYVQQQAAEKATVVESAVDITISSPKSATLTVPIFKMPNLEELVTATGLASTFIPSRALPTRTEVPISLPTSLGSWMTRGDGETQYFSSSFQPTKQVELHPKLSNEVVPLQQQASQGDKRPATGESIKGFGLEASKKPKFLNFLEAKTAAEPKDLKEGHRKISNNPPTESPHSSGSSKRELFLSTDNIAAKLKDTIQASTRASGHIDNNKTFGRYPRNVLMADDDTPISQDMFIEECDITGPESTFASNDVEPMEINQCGENLNTSQENLSGSQVQPESNEEGQGGVPEVTHELKDNSSDLNQSHSAVKLNPSHEDDHTSSDFGAEYGEEMYPSLESPPPFEAIMSPAHASFSASPVKSLDDKDSIGTDKMPAFDFFSSSRQKTAIFGGQSDSKDIAEENNQRSSRFSFLF